MIAYYDGFDEKTRQLPFTATTTAQAEVHANADEKSYKLNDEGALDPMTIWDSELETGHWDNDAQLAVAKIKIMGVINATSETLLVDGIDYNSNLFIYDVECWLSWEKRVNLGIITFPSSVFAIDGSEEVISDGAERTTFISTIFQRIQDVFGGGDTLIKSIANAPNFTALKAISDSRT